jgi:mannose-1-phosphate guanylyltransferase
MSESIRGLILAGGSGRRLAAHTRGLPKQFFSVSNGASLLDDTVSRLAPIASPDQTVVVVDRSHRHHVEALSGPAARARFVYQPGNRGTATGILLGVSAVVERDSNAVIVMTPADHGVRDDSVFQQGIREAIGAVRADRSRVVLFGVEPEQMTGDYGWIVPGLADTNRSLRRVERFVEKPSPELARRLFEAGAVWNSMVLVARPEAILDLFARHLPELLALFDRHAAIAPAIRGQFLANRYHSIPSVDFSDAVLTPAAHVLTLFTWPAAMGWSDLGTPERLTRWLDGRALTRLAS